MRRRDATVGLGFEVLPGGRAIHRPDATLAAMAPYTIRVFGDPVLKQRATEIDNIDGALVRLAEDMLTTMYDAPGLGLAAPQVGVQKRLFVYDIDDEPSVLVNPVITESRGEWTYLEGCLSVPDLHWEIVRPKEVLITGYDLDGNEVADRGRRARWPGSSSTSSTTSTACCCSSTSTTTSARRPRRPCASSSRLARRAAAGRAWPGPPPSLVRRPARSGAGSRRPLPMTAPPSGRPRRLVYLGTPEMAVRPAAWPCTTPASTSPWWCRRADAKRGRGGALVPSPVKAAALELGPARSPTGSTTWSLDLDPAPTSAWWWPTAGSSSPPVLDARAHGQPALLAAAPVAGGGAGRAGHPGRRRAHRRVPHGRRGGARHRRRLRPGRGAPSAPTRPPPSCGPELVAAGTALLVDQLERRAGPAEPQVGEPTYAEKITAAELELDWTGAGGRAPPAGAGRRTPGRRSAAGASRCGAPPLDRRRRRTGRRWPRAQLDGTRVGTGDGALELVEVQPEGKGRQAASAWRNGARPAGDGSAASALRPVDAAPTGARRRRPTAAADAGGVAARRLAIDALVRIDREGAYANLVLPGAAGPLRPRRARPGLRHRAGLRHHPHAAGLRLAGRPLRAPRPRRRRPGPRCASAPTSWPSSTPRPTPRSAPRWRAAPPRSGAWSTPCCAGWPTAPASWPDEATRAELPGLDHRPARAPTSAPSGPAAALESMNERATVGRAGRRLPPGPGLAVGGRRGRAPSRASGCSTCAPRPAARPPPWLATGAARGGRRPAPGAGRAGRRQRRPRLGGRPACRPWPPTARRPPFRPGALRPGAGRRPVLGPGLAAPAPRRPLADRRPTTSTAWPGSSASCSTPPPAWCGRAATLVYSVCTLTGAETVEVDEWLAGAHPELEAVAAPGRAVAAPRARRAAAAPAQRRAHGPTDGMFLLAPHPPLTGPPLSRSSESA